MSKLVSLNLRNLVDAAVWAALVGAALPVIAAFNTPDFSIFNANWSAILNLAINGALVGFVLSVGKNLFTDEDRKLFGKIEI